MDYKDLLERIQDLFFFFNLFRDKCDVQPDARWVEKDIQQRLSWTWSVS